MSVQCRVARAPRCHSGPAAITSCETSFHLDIKTGAWSGVDQYFNQCLLNLFKTDDIAPHCAQKVSSQRNGPTIITDVDLHLVCVRKSLFRQKTTVIIIEPRYSTNVCTLHFCNRILILWNDLPSNVYWHIQKFTIARFNLLVYCDQD